jgi:hypothetical protein
MYRFFLYGLDGIRLVGCEIDGHPYVTPRPRTVFIKGGLPNFKILVAYAVCCRLTHLYPPFVPSKKKIQF